ncbi:MAG: nucleotidyltransferase domain-containing protein [Nanoarchaeota archaeon]
MLTKQQIKIFGAFRENIFERMDFKRIKELAGQASNNVVQIALKEFKEQGLVSAEKAGKSIFYSVDLTSNKALSFLALSNEFSLLKTLPFSVLKTIQQGILEYTPFFILLVFGSYAKGKQTNKSDLDVAVIVESDTARKEIIPSLETVKRRELLEIDYHVFTTAEFIEMLTVDYENVGKQIYRGNKIIFGAMQYYSMIHANSKRYKL